MAKRREQLQTAVRETRKVDDWWRNQLDALPPAYLFAGLPREIVDQLERLRQLSRHDAAAWGQYLPDRRAVEYTIGTYEDITPESFIG